jgi:hypothetical protein
MDAPEKTPRQRAARWFERAHEYVDRARGAASKGKSEKAEEMRRKANRAVKKGLEAMDQPSPRIASDVVAAPERR